MRLLSLVLILFLCSFNIYCQRTITGVVVLKDNQEPLPRIEIFQKGVKGKTSSDINGRFSIVLEDSVTTLIFAFVGMATTEVALKDQLELVVEMEEDCVKCFFDAQVVGIYAKGGLMTHPIGVGLEWSSPWFLRGVIKGVYSYQTNQKENEFHSGKVELLHYISNCDFDMDFRWQFRYVKNESEPAFRVNSFESNFNINNINFIAGYSVLGEIEKDDDYKNAKSGFLLGIGIPLSLPLYPDIVFKATVYQHKMEYQSSIEGGFRGFRGNFKYYKLGSFSELTIGLGYRIGYRLHKRYAEQHRL